MRKKQLAFLLDSDLVVPGLNQKGQVFSDGVGLSTLVLLAEQDYRPHLNKAIDRVFIFNPSLGAVGSDEETTSRTVEIYQAAIKLGIDCQLYNSFKPGDRSPAEFSLVEFLQRVLPDADQTIEALNRVHGYQAA